MNVSSCKLINNNIATEWPESDQPHHQQELKPETQTGYNNQTNTNYVWEFNNKRISQYTSTLHESFVCFFVVVPLFNPQWQMRFLKCYEVCLVFDLLLVLTHDKCCVSGIWCFNGIDLLKRKGPN